jgi:transposase
MLRTSSEREERQAEMRDRLSLANQSEAETGALLNLKEAAKRLGVSLATARRLLRREPGVNLIRTPGSKRTMMRIDPSVIERILRRTANPF